MMEHAHRIRPEHARVLVTGATSGVGEVTARLLASRGARVALLARRPEELQRVVADLGDRARGIRDRRLGSRIGVERGRCRYR